MLSLRISIVLFELLSRQANCYDSHWLGATARAASASTLQLVNVIARFRFVRPLLDLVVSDLALSHRHIV